jgi:hypothetical protein
MRKATLPKNPLPVAKERMIVKDLPDANGITNRDEIELAFATSTRPDATVVPIGRIQPGTFNVTLDFSDDRTRAAYLKWHSMCRDRASSAGQIDTSDGPVVGIDPDYKKQVTLVFHRLYKSAGGIDQPVKVLLRGCFPVSATIPAYDMTSEDMCMLTLSISYDDGEVITS